MLFIYLPNQSLNVVDTREISKVIGYSNLRIKSRSEDVYLILYPINCHRMLDRRLIAGGLRAGNNAAGITEDSGRASGC